MLHDLNVSQWKQGFVSYGRKQHRVLFVPGTRRKIAITRCTDGRIRFLWHDWTRRRWAMTENMYTLRRMLVHMLERYKTADLPMIESLIRDVRNVGVKLAVLPSMGKREIRRLREKINDALIVLDWRQNNHLEEARDQLEWVIALQDSQGRVNLAVLTTRNHTAKARIEARMTEILKITPWVNYYLGVVERLITGHEYLVRSILDMLDPAVWSQGWLGDGALDQLIADAAQLHLPPYRFTRRTTMAELRSVKGKSSTDKEAQRILRRAWEGLEMKRQRAILERLLLAWTQGAPRDEVVRDADRVFYALRPYRISEEGFQYPGKRKAAQAALYAITGHLPSTGIKEALKEATNAL